MTMLFRLLVALARFWRRISRRQISYRACHVADAPDILDDGLVYIVGADGYDWSALMRCPGKCGKRLEMNLLPSAKPVWRVTEGKDGSVSLHPSVWLKTGCKCHFVVRDGNVRWV
jgi:hypothetical protein